MQLFEALVSSEVSDMMLYLLSDFWRTSIFISLIVGKSFSRLDIVTTGRDIRLRMDVFFFILSLSRVKGGVVYKMEVLWQMVGFSFLWYLIIIRSSLSYLYNFLCCNEGVKFTYLKLCMVALNPSNFSTHFFKFCLIHLNLNSYKLFYSIITIPVFLSTNSLT